MSKKTKSKETKNIKILSLAIEMGKRPKTPLFSVIKFEILRQLKKPAFWVAVLLIPILMGGVFLISFLAGKNAAGSEMTIDEDTTIAITDKAGILPKDNPFSLYKNRDDGIKAVKDNAVDLFFYIPADFNETKKAEFYHIVEGIRLFDTSREVLKNILTETVISRIPEIDAIVLTNQFEIQETAFSKNGEDANVLGKAIIPLAILVVFFLFVCIFGNRFLMTVVEEKENRISEMILTSVSAKHLIIGKIVAMMVLGIIQIASLLVPLLILLFIYRDNEMVASILSTIEISPIGIISNLVLFICSILLFSGLCTLVGVLVPTARDASQFIAPVIVGIMLPFYFMQSFLVAEPSFLVSFLTYFPLSAPTALMLRNAFETLNPVEFYLGLAEIIVLAVLSIWFTINLFQKNAVNFEIVKPKLLGRK